MRKKWSCPNCEYNSGRKGNMKRHIASKHYSGTPILNPGYQSITQFRRSTESAETPAAKDKIRSETFAENYQFTDKKLKIFKDFNDANALPEGQTKTLIMADIMERVKNLSPAPFLSLPQGGSFPQVPSFSKSNSDGDRRQTPSNIHTEAKRRELDKFWATYDSTRAHGPGDGGMTRELEKISDKKLSSVLEKFSEEYIERKRLHDPKDLEQS